ncbi:MAG: IS110 family transposase [Aestuariivirga sp.]
MTDTITRTAGIDTGKKHLTLGFWPRGERYTVENTPEGIAKLAKILKKAGVRRVGIESTSIYHFAATEALRAEGFEVAVLQPGQVKAFGKLQRVKSKRDLTDCELVAGAAAGQDCVYPAQSPEIAALAEHLTYLEQCEENCACLKTQLVRYRDPLLIAKKKKEIAHARLLIRTEIKELTAKVKLVPGQAKRLALALSVEGVGLRTALCALIRMPELGSLGRGKAASLLGVAPFDDSSEDYEGVRHIEGGRSRARKAFFLAAFSGALHHNPLLKAFYRRLTGNGKPHTLAVIACTRKLVIILDAIFKRGTPWEKHRGIQCPA